MTENMRNYMRAVSEDKATSKRLQKLAGEDRERAIQEMLADAKARSMPLTEADFASEAVDDDALDAAAGGADCYCIIGGGGTATTEYEETCACVAIGAGTSTDYIKRCMCPLAGEGTGVE